MTCLSCSAARQTNGLWRQYDSLTCKYCAARLIQQIAKLPIPAAEITARRRVVLADAIKAGLDEAEIRALVKGPVAIEPEKNEKKKRKAA